MSSVIPIQNKTKSSLSAIQKTFNRLQKKIQSLQEDLKTLEQDLDACLQFYSLQVQSEQKAFGHTLQELVKILYEYYKIPQGFSKKERALLKEYITDKIYYIFEFILPQEVSPEVQAIFEDFEGTGYDESVEEDLMGAKEELREIFLESGIDLDLSDIDMADDEYTAMQKMFEAMQAAELDREKKPHLKIKSKKQLEKEQKAVELAALQKKGLSTIYKQLAKAFHPDLEQDPALKAEKELLMKSLTVAYDEDDLHTLLSLEMHWMNQAGDHNKKQSDDQIKIYNSILKDQVETLQENIDMMPLHPRYALLPMHLIDQAFDKQFVLQIFYNQLKRESDQLQTTIGQLKSRQNMNLVRNILSAYNQ